MTRLFRCREGNGNNSVSGMHGGGVKVLQKPRDTDAENWYSVDLIGNCCRR